MVNQDSSQLIPLLMTASVSTRGMKGACFSDEEREQMYLETLRYYLETLPEDQPIVFADNSGWNLGQFRSRLITDSREEGGEKRWRWTKEGQILERVEFIAVDPAICDQTRGKGYNEILLMNAVIDRSEKIKQAGAFMKVTGRYPIYNLPRFLKEAREHFSTGGCFYGDMKDHKIFDVLFYFNTTKWNGHSLGTALFAATTEFYVRELSQSFKDCNDYTNDWIEVVWFKIMHKYRIAHDLKIKLRFPVEPKLGGWQGSTNQTLASSQSNGSTKARAVRFVGNCFRVFTPWIWF